MALTLNSCWAQIGPKLSGLLSVERKHSSIQPKHDSFPLCCWQINVLQAKKKFEILDAVSSPHVSPLISNQCCCICFAYVCQIHVWSPCGVCLGEGLVTQCPLQMLSFMRAQYTLFQQGFNILDEIDPYMKKLAAQVRWNKQSRTECHARSNKEIHTHVFTHTGFTGLLLLSQLFTLES